MRDPVITDGSHPVAPRGDVVDVLHGHVVADPYRWLEDADAAATVQWSAAQDQLFSASAASWPGRAAAAARIAELFGTGLVGVPIWRGERCFVVRRLPGQEHAVLHVDEPDGEGGRRDRVLVDPMLVDPAGLTTLDAWQPSKEGHLLAYQLSEGGTEESRLRVLDVSTGEDVDGPIDRTRYSPVAFLPGGNAYYYVRRLAPEAVPDGEEQYHRRVYLHRVGQDPATDVEIFGAGHDIRSYYGVGVSREGDWLTVSRATGTEPRNDLWLAALAGADPQAPVLREVTVGLDAQTSLHVGRDGRLYVSTDLDAPRGRFAVTDPHDPGPASWRTLLGAGGADDGDGAVLEDVALVDGPDLGGTRLVAAWRRHAVSALTVHDADGVRLPGDAGTVPLPGLGSVGGLIERPEGGPEIWFGYTDHTTPQHVYAFDARTGEVTLHAAPPGVVPPRVAVRSRQVDLASADGTTVRMFLVDADPGDGPEPGPRPTVLYGYGGFGISMTPGYSAGILTWVESGGVYAIACLRGGSEEGEDWHRDGMLGAKHHVYEDFEAAAQYLIATGVTTTGQLCISGGSNGGLLVGAALTRRPDLYQAVVCSAPLLDMVRYERFGLGATWNVEYGSADVAEELAWLLSYSPYHHVREGVDYPATLFTVFDGDTRVDPLHARKMCAALQHATSGSRPVLYRREKDVGHGARSVSRTVDLAADTTAFAAYWTGLELR